MKKPSNIKAISAKKTYFLLPGFRAITLFGVVYCKKDEDVQMLNKNPNEIDSTLKSHETIHVRQAESTKNSWFLFYLKYIWQWICNFPLIFVNIMAPYYFIPFELEAYCNENKWKYCKDKCENWKIYKKLSIKEKYKFAKEYFKLKIKFSTYINKYVNKNLLFNVKK